MVFMMLCCSSFAMHWTSWKLVCSIQCICNIVDYLNLTTGLVWVEATRALTTAINPLDKDAEKQNLSGVAPRYASNTLEQYLLSSGASLILSTHLSSENMHAIPVLVILFMFGRITFALGYKYYHAHRAFGHMKWKPSRLFVFTCIVSTAWSWTTLVTIEAGMFDFIQSVHLNVQV